MNANQQVHLNKLYSDVDLPKYRKDQEHLRPCVQNFTSTFRKSDVAIAERDLTAVDKFFQDWNMEQFYHSIKEEAPQDTTISLSEKTELATGTQTES